MQKRCIVNEGLLRMRQFCFSPSSIGRRCFNEEQVWLNGRNRLNSATQSACLLCLSLSLCSFFLLLFFIPGIAKRFCDSFSRARARILFFLFCKLFSRRQQGRSRSTRSITGDPSDDGQVYGIMYLPCDSGHLCETFAFKGNQKHRRLR